MSINVGLKDYQAALLGKTHTKSRVLESGARPTSSHSQYGERSPRGTGGGLALAKAGGGTHASHAAVVSSLAPGGGRGDLLTTTRTPVANDFTRQTLSTTWFESWVLITVTV